MITQSLVDTRLNKESKGIHRPQAPILCFVILEETEEEIQVDYIARYICVIVNIAIYIAIC